MGECMCCVCVCVSAYVGGSVCWGRRRECVWGEEEGVCVRGGVCVHVCNINNQ